MLNLKRMLIFLLFFFSVYVIFHNCVTENNIAVTQFDLDCSLNSAEIAVQLQYMLNQF